MTTETYIQENQTQLFKKGDKVVMHTCHEATFEKYKDKIWTCLTDSFLNKGKEEVVFLMGFSGFFSAKFLKHARRCVYCKNLTSGQNVSYCDNCFMNDDYSN